MADDIVERLEAVKTYRPIDWRDEEELRSAIEGGIAEITRLRAHIKALEAPVTSYTMHSDRLVRILVTPPALPETPPLHVTLLPQG